MGVCVCTCVCVCVCVCVDHIKKAVGEHLGVLGCLLAGVPEAWVLGFYVGWMASSGGNAFGVCSSK